MKVCITFVHNIKSPMNRKDMTVIKKSELKIIIILIKTVSIIF
jgi:hypothetical protein